MNGLIQLQIRAWEYICQHLSMQCVPFARVYSPSHPDAALNSTRQLTNTTVVVRNEAVMTADVSSAMINRNPFVSMLVMTNSRQ